MSLWYDPPIAYIFAAASGLLLVFSFPKFGHPALAWAALTPLLVALSGSVSPTSRQSGPTLSRAFLLGLTTGLIYFAGTLYWITGVMATYGGMHTWVAVLLNAALVAYLALYPALFAVVVRRAIMSLGQIALMSAPFVWVATELGRTHVLTGFPWVLLGYSQSSVLPIAQAASVFGVYGVSALVASVASAGALVALSGRSRRGLVSVTLIAIVVLTTSVWGSVRVSDKSINQLGEPIKVGLIQGNVDQALKWDPVRARDIFQDYLRMTRQAVADGAQLVVWPESSTPFYFEEDRVAADEVRSIARQFQVSILLGSDEIERGTPTRYYNSAFLVRPDGSTGATYRKMHLVPFGEYVPLKSLLFFAAPLVEAVSDFSSGSDPTLLPIHGHLISTAICYEIVYPDLVRRFVTRGSQLLTTITNDAWFGRTSAPYQHFAQAAMRAIEEGRYLVRAANTGVTGVVDPYGRVLAKTDIFVPAVITADVRLLHVRTMYARIGDGFAYASALMTIGIVVVSRRRGQGRRRVQ